VELVQLQLDVVAHEVEARIASVTSV